MKVVATVVATAVAAATVVATAVAPIGVHGVDAKVAQPSITTRDYIKGATALQFSAVNVDPTSISSNYEFELVEVSPTVYYGLVDIPDGATEPVEVTAPGAELRVNIS